MIVTLEDGADLPYAFQRYSHNGKLTVIHGYVLDQVPVSLLATLANSGSTHRVHINRPAHKHDALSSVAVNANAVDLGNGINNPNLYSYTGAGVTVAFIDSGITSYQHPDLADARVLAFVDFVNGRTAQLRRQRPRHARRRRHRRHRQALGEEVRRHRAGRVARVAESARRRTATARSATSSRRSTGCYTNGKAYGIRVVNLSVGAAVTESYYTDPLTLATKALVDSGVTVVAAAGNNGKNANGQPQWGGIASPGNAPWVLTVCAFSTKGTYNVADDKVADFSSSGPTAIDFSAKPDLCAPGVGVVSTAAPGSTLFQTGLLATPSWLLPGHGVEPAIPTCRMRA